MYILTWMNKLYNPQMLCASVYGGYAHAIASTPYSITHSSNVGWVTYFADILAQ